MIALLMVVMQRMPAPHFYQAWQAERLARKLVTTHPDSSDPTREALQKMGTNAIPPLWDLFTGERAKSQANGGKWRLFFEPKPSRRDMMVGYRGLKALGPVAQPVTSNLVDLVIRSPNQFPRERYAVDILSTIGPVALPHILQAVTNSTRQGRIMLLDALPFYGEHLAPALPDLIRLLNDSNEVIQSSVIFALRQIPSHPPAIPLALMAAFDGASPRVQHEILHALTTFGPSNGPIASRLSRVAAGISPDDPTQVVIGDILIGSCSTNFATEHVHRLLESTNPTNATWALDSCTKVGMPFTEIGMIALRFLNHENEALQLQAAAELGQAARMTGYPGNWVDSGLTNPVAAVRLKFLENAWKFVPSILPVALRAMANTDSKVRAFAVGSLAVLGRQARPVVNEIGRMLDDPDLEVRRNAYRTLNNVDSDSFPAEDLLFSRGMSEKDVHAMAKAHFTGNFVPSGESFLAQIQMFGGLARSMTTLPGGPPPGALPSLKAALRGTDGFERFDVALALVRMAASNSDARKDVLDILKSSHGTNAPGVELVAALALSGTNALDIWLDLAGHGTKELRIMALMNMGRNHSPNLLQLMEAGITAQSFTNLPLAQPLTGENRDKVIQMLLEASKDSDPAISELAKSQLRRVDRELVNPPNTKGEMPPKRPGADVTR